VALSAELETIFMLEDVANNTGLNMDDVVSVVKEWEKQKEKNKKNHGEEF